MSAAIGTGRRDTGQPQRVAIETGVGTKRQSGQLAVFGGRVDVVEQPGRDVQIGDRERAGRVSVLLGHDREIHMGAAHFGSEQLQKTRFRRMRDRRRIDGDRSRVQRRADPGDGSLLVSQARSAAASWSCSSVSPKSIANAFHKVDLVNHVH